MPRPTLVLAMAPALTSDLFTPAHTERLRTLCRVPDPLPLARFDEPRAAELLADADVLLTGWGCPAIDAGVLSRAPKLRLIAHAAGTVKGHVSAACFERGILVTAAAAANAIPVAEYTIATILLAGKRVFRLQRRYAELRAGRLWTREVPPLGNLGRVVGIVGASHVGRLVLERLRAFGFRVLLYDPFVDADEARALGAEAAALDGLLAASDIVSLHAPALPETRHQIDARRLALMRDGAVLVNTARGWLVDTDALTAELVSGRLDAVLDTTEPEVLPADSPLYDLPNVFLTPHVAGALGVETRRMSDLALDEIERFARGEPLAHEVRAEDLSRIA